MTPLHHIKNRTKNLPPLRVGIGGPVGSGKTTLLEMLCKAMRDAVRPGRHHQRHLHQGRPAPADRERRLARRAHHGRGDRRLPAHRHPRRCSINLEAIDRMLVDFPNADIVFIESGGDNLAATFSPELSDLTIYVIDVAAGEKIPRKGGPGITKSDLFVINKTDLAPYVGANLDVMAADTDAHAHHAQGAQALCHDQPENPGRCGEVVAFIESKGMLKGLSRRSQLGHAQGPAFPCSWARREWPR